MGLNESKGKAYANKKPQELHPVGDFYSTPKSLVWVAEEIITQEFQSKHIAEVCSGRHAITEELERLGYLVVSNDLYLPGSCYSDDYLSSENWNAHSQIITNPPFSHWDAFVDKAKTHCEKFMFIGRTNYLGTAGRLRKGIWDGLKAIYVFNRYVDYRTPLRNDGMFCVGAMCTAWFLWQSGHDDAPEIHFLDVNPWAKLGAYDKETGGQHG